MGSIPRPPDSSRLEPRRTQKCHWVCHNNGLNISRSGNSDNGTDIRRVLDRILNRSPQAAVRAAAIGARSLISLKAWSGARITGELGLVDRQLGLVGGELRGVSTIVADRGAVCPDGGSIGVVRRLDSG